MKKASVLRESALESLKKRPRKSNLLDKAAAAEDQKNSTIGDGSAKMNQTGQNSYFKLAGLGHRTNTFESDSNFENESSYNLHPQILNNLKVEKGSIDAFMKKDDLEELIKSDLGVFDSDFIVGKIDRIGLVGKKARLDTKKKRLQKQR